MAISTVARSFVATVSSYLEFTTDSVHVPTDKETLVIEGVYPSCNSSSIFFRVQNDNWSLHVSIRLYLFFRCTCLILPGNGITPAIVIPIGQLNGNDRLSGRCRRQSRRMLQVGMQRRGRSQRYDSGPQGTPTSTLTFSRRENALVEAIFSSRGANFKQPSLACFK